MLREQVHSAKLVHTMESGTLRTIGVYISPNLHVEYVPFGTILLCCRLLRFDKCRDARREPPEVLWEHVQTTACLLWSRLNIIRLIVASTRDHITGVSSFVSLLPSKRQWNANLDARRCYGEYSFRMRMLRHEMTGIIDLLAQPRRVINSERVPPPQAGQDRGI